MGPIVDRVFVGIILGGLATWVAWGWRTWVRKRPDKLRAGIRCSLAGFVFASLSASLEVGTGIYAQFTEGFPFMNPTLLRIYAWGFVSAFLGLLLGLCGAGNKSPLRWKTPALSTILLLLWLGQAMGE